jgi:hypothetical protein
MNRGQSSSGLDTSTPIFQSLAFVNFIHRHQPNLCNACINLASIFDESTETSRDLDKQGSSSIKHHDTLTSLLVCKSTCTLCSLILAAVPYRTEWFLWEIARDILVVEYKSAKVTNRADSWDRDGWLFQNLSEWKKCLANPKLKATPKTAKITSWTNQYNRRLIQVGLPKTVPLYEILNGMQADLGQFSMLLKINKSSQAIRIREHYTTKGQLADFALALQTERGSGLRTLSSGTLRISSSPGTQFLLQTRYGTACLRRQCRTNLDLSRQSRS